MKAPPPNFVPRINPGNTSAPALQRRYGSMVQTAAKQLTAATSLSRAAAAAKQISEGGWKKVALDGRTFKGVVTVPGSEQAELSVLITQLRAHDVTLTGRNGSDLHFETPEHSDVGQSIHELIGLRASVNADAVKQQLQEGRWSQLKGNPKRPSFEVSIGKGALTGPADIVALHIELQKEGLTIAHKAGTSEGPEKWKASADGRMRVEVRRGASPLVRDVTATIAQQRKALAETVIAQAALKPADKSFKVRLSEPVTQFDLASMRKTLQASGLDVLERTSKPGQFRLSGDGREIELKRISRILSWLRLP